MPLNRAFLSVLVVCFAWLMASCALPFSPQKGAAAPVQKVLTFWDENAGASRTP